MSIEKSIEKTVQSEKANLVFGTDRVSKLLKEGKLKMVVYSQNTPEEVVKSLESKKGSVELHGYEGSATKLGTICGRPHTISVLGIKK